MRDLLEAIKLRQKYNIMDFDKFIIEFENFTGEKVPQKAIDEWRFCGLNNVDFLTSEFLTDFGINVKICSICEVSFLDKKGNCELCTKELCSPVEF